MNNLKQKSILSKDNVKIYYYIKNSSANSPYLLFLHGAGSNHSIWDPIIPEFKKYNLVLIDLRGHGRSDVGSLKNITLANFADDIKKILDSEKISKVIMIGNSLGASIAAEFSKKYSQNLEKAILISIFSKKYLRFINLFKILNNLVYFMISPFKMKRKLKIQDYSKLRETKLWLFPVVDLKGTYLHVYLKLIKDLLKYQIDFQNFSAPTLILQGKHDIITKNMKIFKNTKNIDNIDFKLINTHHLIVNNHPNICIKCIKKFIEEA